MTGISVKNLFVHHGAHSVLEDVQFEAGAGEFIAVVGRSGSGKTTFLHALADFIPYSGKISLPEHVGVVFQHYAVFPWLTVSENISFGLEGRTEADQKRIVQEHLKLAQLEDKKDKYPAELSGGQVQRVALARSLAPGPEALLMDEPYGALDAYTRGRMQQWLLEVWSKHKKTVVFVTHNIEEAIFLADRVLVLKDKRFAREFSVPFSRPRSEGIKFTPEFNSLKKEIFASINS